MTGSLLHLTPFREFEQRVRDPIPPPQALRVGAGHVSHCAPVSRIFDGGGKSCCMRRSAMRLVFILGRLMHAPRMFRVAGSSGRFGGRCATAGCGRTETCASFRYEPDSTAGIGSSRRSEMSTELDAPSPEFLVPGTRYPVRSPDTRLCDWHVTTSWSASRRNFQHGGYAKNRCEERREVAPLALGASASVTVRISWQPTSSSFRRGRTGVCWSHISAALFGTSCGR